MHADEEVCGTEPIAAGETRELVLRTTEPIPHLDNGDATVNLRDGAVTVGVTVENPTEPTSLDLHDTIMPAP